ncbi:unnamed protein product [Rhizophagus irregularis]|nr:unnamed protein product [Rhizophagus irregularis]
MDPYRPGHYAQYRAPYERPPYTPPGGPPTYGQTSWDDYTSGTPTQRSAYMASRPGYGIPLVVYHQWQADGKNSQGIMILINTILSNSFKRRHSFRIYLGLESFNALIGHMNIFRPIRKSKGFGFVEYTDADSVLRALRVLGGEGSGDDKKIREVVLPALKEVYYRLKLMRTNSRKYLDQYEASKPRTVHDTELDKNALLSIIIVVEYMTRPQDRRDLSPSINSQHENKLLINLLAIIRDVWTS